MINDPNRIGCKSQITLSAKAAADQRREATRLLNKGRRLRAKARGLGRYEPDTRDIRDRLVRLGDVAHYVAIYLRNAADKGRKDRRHQCLASALANGKTYNQCESKYDLKPTGAPQAALIEPHLQNHLRPEERRHALHIAEVWLGKGDVRLSRIRAQGLAVLIAKDKKDAEVQEVQRKIQEAEKTVRRAQNLMERQTRELGRFQQDEKMAVEKLATLQARLTALRSEMADPPEDRPITCTDDLFDEAA